MPRRAAPRIYTPVERQKSVDAGRDRIIVAARQLLEGDDVEAFSVDAVARRAGVSRATVYNQFESKAGLLEALFDAMAVRGPLGEMSAVFALTDPRATLDAFIDLFGRFWTLSRRAHGRLAAAAASDPELAVAMAGRTERRRASLTALIGRFGKELKPVVPKDELVNVLFVLLSFQTFDALAGNTRTPGDVAPIVRRAVYALLGLPLPRQRAAAKRTT